MNEIEETTTEQKILEREFAEFIDRQRWIFARTYASFCPHEYIVKNRLPQEEWAEFEKFVIFIRKYGWDSIFGKDKEPKQYYSMGEWYYWTMGDPVEETIILNRARFEDYIFEVDDFGDLRCRSKYWRGKSKE